MCFFSLTYLVIYIFLHACTLHVTVAKSAGFFERKKCLNTFFSHFSPDVLNLWGTLRARCEGDEQTSQKQWMCLITSFLKKKVILTHYVINIEKI